MTLSSDGVAAERLTVGMTSVEYRAADQVTSVESPDQNRNGNDNDLTLDEPEAVNSNAGAPGGMEDSKLFGLASEVPHQRVAASGHILSFYTTSFVEPRFLRHARLLN